MGRIFEARKTTMFARWNKMAKAFTRISREIAVAVKAGGPNPDLNAQLRRAVQNARAVNMPKDKVEAAIKRASGSEQQDYAIVIYEGYGPHGIPLLIESATDNATRTVANIRKHFRDYKGNLGASGSVSFQFQQMGVFRFPPENLDLEALEMDLIDHGLEEMGEGVDEKGEKQIIVRGAFQSFGLLQAAIEKLGIQNVSAASEYIPKDTAHLSEEQEIEVLELVDALEQDDDVQRVFHNLA